MVDHGHDGVEVHVAPQDGQPHCVDDARRALPEQRARDQGDGLRRRALAHPDQDGAVADRHDVAPLDRRAAPVLVDAAEPDVDAAVAREHRVEAVDGLHEDGLRPARLLGHGVERDAVVDPAGRIALEDEVRQRRQKHLGRACGLVREALALDVGLRHAADQVVGDLGRSGGLAPLAAAPGEVDPDLPLVEHAVEHPLARLGDREHLGEQLLRVEDLHAPVAHDADEGVVLLLRALDPDHVVEQQLLGVRRRQPGVLAARPVHEHLVELAHFGSDAELLSRSDLGLELCCHGRTPFVVLRRVRLRLPGPQSRSSSWSNDRRLRCHPAATLLSATAAPGDPEEDRNPREQHHEALRDGLVAGAPDRP